MKYLKKDLIFPNTPIQPLRGNYSNQIYVKRDDLLGPSFGGNKGRKLEYFLADALKKGCDYIVTYGSPHSNHCRLTAEMSSMSKLSCLLILSDSCEQVSFSGNFFLYHLYNVSISWTTVDQVNITVEKELLRLKKEGYSPYFIPGGGHGILGTHSYIEGYFEIDRQRKELDIDFDYIFHATGTGTTQAGLILGKHLINRHEEIIGISIARNRHRAKQVIKEAIDEYANENNLKFPGCDEEILIIDDYIGRGYGDVYLEVLKTIKEAAQVEGILFDPIYTGKAFFGMMQYLFKNQIQNKRVLFIHTGGVPILMSYASKYRGDQNARSELINN